MQQTLLAIAAMMIISMVTLNQMRSVMMIERSAYQREMEGAALDYARMQIQQVYTQVAFDESRVGVTDFSVETKDLSNVASLGVDTGEKATDPTTFDDLDDYNGYSANVWHGVGQDSFRFSANYTVRYVNPNNPTSTAGSPSLAKELLLEIGPHPDDSTGIPINVSMSQVVSITDYN